MAKVTLNPALRNISGSSGNIVFRRVNDQTVLARRPEGVEREPSSAQLAQRDRFRRAGDYAREVLSDPWQRRIYEALGAERQRRADKLIASDYLSPPVVELVELSAYRGVPGDIVRVLAADDIEVVSVHVAIRTTDGLLVEQGSAEKVHGVWLYQSVTTAPAGVALSVTATAKDRPGHEGVQTVVHPGR